MSGQSVQWKRRWSHQGLKLLHVSPAITKMGDRLRVCRNQPFRPTQPPTLSGMGQEYQPMSSGSALPLGGNRRSNIALAMHHKFCGISTLNGLRKRDKHPAYSKEHDNLINLINAQTITSVTYNPVR